MENILILGVGLDPSPQLDTSASFSCSVPWPLSPVIGIPSPHTEPQVQFLCVNMLQNLTKRAREVAEVLSLKVCCAFVAAEVERGQKGVLGQGPEEEALAVVGTRRDECD